MTFGTMKREISKLSVFLINLVVDTIITFGNSWLNNPSCGSIITNVSLVLQPPAKLSTPSKNSGPAVNTNDQGVILGVSGQRKLSSLVIFGIVCGCLAFVIFCFIIFVISVRNIRQRYPNRKPLPRSLRFLSIRRRNTSVQKHAERTLERVALEEQQRF